MTMPTFFVRYFFETFDVAPVAGVCYIATVTNNCALPLDAYVGNLATVFATGILSGGIMEIPPGETVQFEFTAQDPMDEYLLVGADGQTAVTCPFEVSFRRRDDLSCVRLYG